jgi:hypothetical protein
MFILVTATLLTVSCSRTNTLQEQAAGEIDTGPATSTSTDASLAGPPPTGEPTPEPVGPPTTSTARQPASDFIEFLAAELEQRGVAAEQARCLIDGLRGRDMSEAALRAGQLQLVVQLDEAARECSIDLLRYIES